MPNERQIIVEIQNGDKESYRLLVDRYQEGLVRYCFTIVQDEAAAIDVAQQAFINAYQKIDSYKPKYAFSTWLYRIARNEALREQKRIRKYRPIEENEDKSDKPELSENLEKAEDAERVRKAILTLRNEWRTAVHFYYWEGKSYEEISETMDKPINTVRVWLRRAKQQLEKELT